MSEGMSQGNDRNRRIANESWKKGSEALSRQNWDLAIMMFQQATKLCPELLLYRQSLRGAQEKKHPSKRPPTLGFMSLSGIRGRVKKARSAKNWNELDEAAEEGLAIFPWDAAFNADVGEACRERGFDEVAAFAYQKAVAMDEKNEDYLNALAEVLIRRGEYDQAASCYQRLTKIDPLSGEYRSKLNNTHVLKTMDRGGYDDAKNTQEVKKGYEQSVSATKEDVVGPGISVEADLQRMIRKQPNNRDNYMKLADFYKREGKFESAEETLKKSLEFAGNDPSVREQIEDLEMERLRKAAQQARDNAHKAPDDEHAKRESASLANQLLEREIEVMLRRVERYPADMRMKFELAQRLMRVGRIRDAVPLLQQALKDTKNEAMVAMALGKCFLALKQTELAKRQYKLASEKLSPIDNPDHFCEAHYRLGLLAEEAKDLAAAENHYTEVISINYGYKDAKDRLERLQSGGTL